MNQSVVSVDVSALLEILQSLSGLGNEVRILRAQLAEYETAVRQLRESNAQLSQRLAAADKQDAPVIGGPEG